MKLSQPNRNLFSLPLLSNSRVNAWGKHSVIRNSGHHATNILMARKWLTSG